MQDLNFPATVSNSMREAWVACPRKWYYTYLQALVPQSTSIDLLFGSAFAKGLEVARRKYISGENPQDSVAMGAIAATQEFGDPMIPPGREHKGPFQLWSAIDAYFEQYPLDTDPVRIAIIEGSPSIEFTFSIGLPIDNPLTGQPLVYVGRYDWSGIFDNRVWCVDEKTQSRLGSSWAEHWRLNSQFMGYMWAARESGLEVVGTIVRGIAVRKSGSVDFAEAYLTYRKWVIDRWYEQLLRDIHQMIEAYHEGIYGYDLSNSCSAYGNCKFVELCNSKDPEKWVPLHYNRDNKRIEASKELVNELVER